MRYIIIFIVLILILGGAFLYTTKRNLTDQTQESSNKILMEYAPEKTKIDNASDVPQGADKYLPARGFLFVSGGFVSASRRLSVDIDKNLLSYGIGQDKNQTPYEKLSREKEVILKKESLEQIISLVNEIWASNKNFSSNTITADFNVLLILSDSGKVRVINSYGPPVDEVNKLYEMVWNLASENASTK